MDINRFNKWLTVGTTISVVIICVFTAHELSAQQGGAADIYDFKPHISGRVQVHLDNARACYEKDDFDCAREALGLIPRRKLSNQERLQYWNRLAWVEFLDGNFGEAVTAYQNAYVLSDNPRQRQAMLRNMAQLHASMGQFQEAYNTLEELLVLKGEYPLGRGHLTAEALWRGLDVYVIGSWDLVPLVPAQPDYPAEAAAQGLLNGFVDLEFTVTRTGSTMDINVIESSSPLFERSAIEAAEKLRYKPKLVDGRPVESAGVQHRFEFQSEDLD